MAKSIKYTITDDTLTKIKRHLAKHLSNETDKNRRRELDDLLFELTYIKETNCQCS